MDKKGRQLEVLATKALEMIKEASSSMKNLTDGSLVQEVGDSRSKRVREEALEKARVQLKTVSKMPRIMNVNTSPAKPAATEDEWRASRF